MTFKVGQLVRYASAFKEYTGTRNWYVYPTYNPTYNTSNVGSLIAVKNLQDDIFEIMKVDISDELLDLYIPRLDGYLIGLSAWHFRDANEDV